ARSLRLPAPLTRPRKRCTTLGGRSRQALDLRRRSRGRLRGVGDAGGGARYARVMRWLFGRSVQRLARGLALVGVGLGVAAWVLFAVDDVEGFGSPRRHAAGAGAAAALVALWATGARSVRGVLARSVGGAIAIGLWFLARAPECRGEIHFTRLPNACRSAPC